MRYASIVLLFAFALITAGAAQAQLSIYSLVVPATALLIAVPSQAIAFLAVTSADLS
jgi:hypothetical protein